MLRPQESLKEVSIAESSWSNVVDAFNILKDKTNTVVSDFLKDLNRLEDNITNSYNSIIDLKKDLDKELEIIKISYQEINKKINAFEGSLSEFYEKNKISYDKLITLKDDLSNIKNEINNWLSSDLTIINNSLKNILDQEKKLIFDIKNKNFDSILKDIESMTNSTKQCFNDLEKSFSVNLEKISSKIVNISLQLSILYENERDTISDLKTAINELYNSGNKELHDLYSKIIPILEDQKIALKKLSSNITEFIVDSNFFISDSYKNISQEIGSALNLLESLKDYIIGNKKLLTKNEQLTHLKPLGDSKLEPLDDIYTKIKESRDKLNINIEEKKSLLDDENKTQTNETIKPGLR